MQKNLQHVALMIQEFIPLLSVIIKNENFVLQAISAVHVSCEVWFSALLVQKKIVVRLYQTHYFYLRAEMFV